MTHKLSWLFLTAAVFGSGVFATRLLSMTERHAAASPTPEQQQLIERLERLEAGLPKMKQTLTAQMGAVALNAAAAAAKPAGQAVDDDAEPQSPPRPKLSASEYAAKEREHFDQLDQLVKKGGGAAVTAQLRKSIEAAGATDKRLALDVGRLDCSDTLCRVEVRTNGDANVVMNGVRVLGTGMGGLSMRPRTPGQPRQPDVYYVAAPGQELPGFDY